MDLSDQWRVLALLLLTCFSFLCSYYDVLVRRTSPYRLRQVLRSDGATGTGLLRVERLGGSLRIALLLVDIPVVLLAFQLLAGRGFHWAGIWAVTGGLLILTNLVLPLLLYRPGLRDLHLLERGFLRVLETLLLPLVWPLADRMRPHLLGEGEGDLEEHENRAEEEIQSILEVGEAEGIFDKEEGEMIQSVLEFGDTVVHEVMVPRTEMVAIPLEIKREEFRGIVMETGHSRFPVHGRTIDDVEGVVHAKDLLQVWDRDESEWELQAHLRQPLFIPGNKPVLALLKEFRSERFHMAIVVDEYGGVEGIVTLEDLIEELVGEIQDEYDAEEQEEVKVLEQGRFEIDAGIRLEDLAEKIGLELPEGEYETLGGYLTEQLGRIPDVDAEIQAEGHLFRVISADSRRIRTVLVEHRSPGEKQQEPEEPRP